MANHCPKNQRQTGRYTELQLTGTEAQEQKLPTELVPVEENLKL